MAQEWKPLNPPTPPEPEARAAPAGPHRWRTYFRGPPVRTPEGLGPFGMPAELADDLAVHIEKAGFVHVDELAALIEAAGGLDGLVLPRPTRHQEPPEHGQDTWTNPPRWADEEDS